MSRVRLNKKIYKKATDYTPDIIFHAELKVKDNDSDDLFVQGWASTADLDRIDDIVEPSAFKKTIKEFMRNPVLLHNHGMGIEGRVPIGKVVEAEIKPKGLFVKAFISKTEETLREKIKEGLYSAFSFGFRIINSDIIKKTGKSIRKITELELFEISVVSIPMNRRALFSVVKGFECTTDLVYKDDFVEGLKDNIKGVQGDLDLAHKRICSVEDEIKGLKDIYVSSERQWFKEALKEDNDTDTTEHSKGGGTTEDKKPVLEEGQKEIEGIEQEDNLQFNPIDKIKSLEEEVRDLKAGRVLSGNNRKTLSAALEAMGSASVALKAVLGIQEADSRTIKEEPEKKEDQFSEELIDGYISKVAEAAIELVGI